MKVPTHHRRETVSMAELSNNPSRGVTPGMSNDKGRKTNGQRRMLPGGHKTFGVPLSDLVHRAPQGYNVPFIVKKICTFIEHHGVNQEGIFRINGSQKIVEKLKLQCDHHGYANLEEDGDIMAVAGLLKLFLRELPESVIPEHMTRRFVNIQEEYQRNSSECVVHLKGILGDLPGEHYNLLKHIIRFLAIVACNEPVNKMSPMALAIVFGPNLFRCGKGFIALKDQGTTNQIVYRFIVDYDQLFKDVNEDSPAVYWERKKHNLVPPRPPPPKFYVEETETFGSSMIKPVPSPRKSKIKNHEGGWYDEDQDRSESSLSSRGRNSHSQQSPSFSDDEMTGRLSPFHLDSDSGFSLVESPVPSARTSEGEDFRKEFSRIGTDLLSRFPELPAIVLTATASPAAQQQIIKSLKLKQVKVIAINPDRPNIKYKKVLRPPSTETEDHLEDILTPMVDQLITEQLNYPLTIVYTDTSVISFAYSFFEKKMGKNQYIGANIPENRLFAQYQQVYTESMKKFIVQELCKEQSRIRIIFATVALGMGLNAPHIRKIIHYKPPTSLEKYFQETGRAGRDGAKSTAVLYYNNTDIRKNRPGIEKNIISYCQNTTRCYRAIMLEYFGYEPGEEVENGFCCDICDSLL